MIDLETLGKTPDAPIWQIGWCLFDINGERPSPRSLVVDPQTHMDLGARADWSTIKWWMSADQTPAREGLLVREELHIAVALAAFATAIPPDVSRVWANGAAFDFPIIENAFRRCGHQIPWKFRQVMDMRTARTLYPRCPRVEPRIPHDAGEDAVAQAVWLQHAFVGVLR
jgi:hypothetical protein